MRLVVLFIIIFLSSTCLCQELKDRMTTLVNGYFDHDQADSSGRKISLNRGFVVAPLLCTNRRTGTIDSDKGELLYRELLINYDIGFMAGTHAAPGNRTTFSWYDERLIRDNKVCIGLKKENDAWKLVMTMRKNSGNMTKEEPANFWANVKDEEEVRDIIKIAFSYRQESPNATVR
ncbi:MAG: hypothetical protein JNK14_02130 [Chitinophagaceae bacterium]|nr:hypothetical protein [Chitinophagaceae bacterium]